MLQPRHGRACQSLRDGGEKVSTSRQLGAASVLGKCSCLWSLASGPFQPNMGRAGPQKLSSDSCERRRISQGGQEICLTQWLRQLFGRSLGPSHVAEERSKKLVHYAILENARLAGKDESLHRFLNPRVGQVVYSLQ